MNTPNIYSERQVTLPDGRPGLRRTMQMDVREPSPSPGLPCRSEAKAGGEGRDEGELSPHISQGEGSSAVRDNSCNSCNAESPCLDFISSDETLDRYDEIISASGWKLDTYRKNPVFQNAHQYGDIIFTLGRALITEVRSGSPLLGERERVRASSPSPYLFQRIQFATDANPMAKIAHALYSGKFLRAVSVGFIPLRWEDANGVDHQRSAGVSPASPAGVHAGDPSFRTPISELRSPQFRRRFIEQELLEVSAVAIPANPNALALGLKSGAIEKSDLRDLADLINRALGHREASWTAAAERSADAAFSPGSTLHAPCSLRLLPLARTLRDLLKHL